MRFEIDEYIYNILSMLYIKAELFKKERHFKLAYLFNLTAYQISKSIDISKVK